MVDNYRFITVVIGKYVARLVNYCNTLAEHILVLVHFQGPEVSRGIA